MRKKVLSDLFKLADTINQFRLTSWLPNLFKNYQFEIFETKYCGEPGVYGSVNIPFVFTYITNSSFNGIPLNGSISIVMCRDTGMVDLNNQIIYEGVNGELFVFNYTSPSSGKETATFSLPRVYLDGQKTNQQMFSSVSDILVEQIIMKSDLNDPLTKINLANKLTELQLMAYQKGKSKDEIKTKKDLSMHLLGSWEE